MSLVSPVVQALQPLGATLEGINLGEPSLEDVFIHLTGRALRWAAMSDVETETTTRRPITPFGAFLAVLGRDVFVTGRELPIFLAQVVLQPLFLLFVFGKIQTQLGYAQHGAQVLFPGLVALASVLTVCNPPFPLVIEFSYTSTRSRTASSLRFPSRWWPREGGGGGAAGAGVGRRHVPGRRRHPRRHPVGGRQRRLGGGLPHPRRPGRFRPRPDARHVRAAQRINTCSP